MATALGGRMLLAILFWTFVHSCSGVPVSPLDLPSMMALQSLFIQRLPELSTWNASADCTTWQRVSCDYNRISALYFLDAALGGPFPYVVTNLTGLRILYLRNNQFTGSFPEDISKLKSLQALRIDGNQLVGTMPDGFSQLKSLYKFHIASNLNLTGPFPDSWSNFNLQEFYVGGNKFSGPVPNVICSWSNLMMLKMGGTPFTGSIPSCLSRNTQLQELYMDNCALSGTIPDLGNIKSLQRIFLNGNNITGPIPPSIGNNTNLNVLFLSGNRITGPLPDTMGALTKLTAWVMEFNSIDGTIPQSIGNMTVVQRILLDNNLLTGTIPATLGNLKQLTILLLEGNGLTGRIPPEIAAGCSKLNQFNVESNLLSGIPPGGFISNNLYQVNYRSNYFSGLPNFTKADGSKFCPPFWPTSWIHSSVAYNCFMSSLTTGCKDNDKELLKFQRSASICASICGANNSVGPCGGHGYCGADKTCICDSGFVRSNNGSTCVLATVGTTTATMSSAAKAESILPEAGLSLTQKSFEAQSTCSVGAKGAGCPMLLCSNSVGYGCSCAQGVALNTPYCQYNTICMDMESCPERSTCTDSGHLISCSCPTGFRPIKSRAMDSFFAYCAKTKCTNEESFVGFQCSTL